MSVNAESTSSQKISITPLLRRLWPSPSDHNVTPTEIAHAISYIFRNQLSPVQAGALLTCLHFTGWDQRPDVLSECASSMREAAETVDYNSLAAVIRQKDRGEGAYNGGLCDIVGTGGDSHHTFNVSTTSSILASALLLIGKHGNRASTSRSGSADLLQSTVPIPPNLAVVTSHKLSQVYEHSNYAFLFAPNFHPGMKYVVPVRKELGWRTIFNLLGPLTNPVEKIIEARVIGVARRDIGPVFADSLKMQGIRKALIICGEEDLDEISCAGRTHCWRLVGSCESQDVHNSNDIRIETFTLSPLDFGLPFHSLESVSPGKEPHENAKILLKILQNKMPPNDPILHFVLMNVSALLVMSGICEADSSDMGYGDNGMVITERGPGGGRWKEGVRRARWAIESGESLRQWENFIHVSNSF